MASDAAGSPDALSADERERFERLRAATSLAELEGITGTDSPHDAYFAAKAEWRSLAERALDRPVPVHGIPGRRVRIDGLDVCVHGVTHSGTDAERSYLRERVGRLLDRGHDVFCEQGIRRLYFTEYPDVCEMDDYEWAQLRCAELDVDGVLSPLLEPSFEGFIEDVDGLLSQLRDGAFTLIDSGRDVYGDAFGETLGDVASALFVSHEDMATGEDFAAFRRTRAAAADPTALPDLQRYYETTFLPQPIEREWLRRHDRELEILTHARNERMADSLLYHADDDPIHAIVGAAHQPGVVYYLEAVRDGRRSVADFEPIG
jgi:hypothetical protein